MLRLIGIVVAMGLSCGCYGPFVSVAHVDEASASALANTIKIYSPADLTGADYLSVGVIDATSCRNKAWDPPATEADAVSQLRFKAFSLNANGLILWGCESYGVELSKNCWSSVTCRATAIRVTPSTDPQPRLNVHEVRI